jgi:hypothetical protein
MIQLLSNLEEFKSAITSKGFEENIETFLKLDLAFFEHHENYTVISLPKYGAENERDLLFLSKESTIVFSSSQFVNYQKNFKKVVSKPYGESTVITFLELKEVLRTYSKEFERIRAKMNELDLSPVLENIEDSGRGLRLLTDRLESLVQIIMSLKEKELREFNVELISFEYDLLMTEARYWLERCRSHVYRIASLRTKSEMESNRELNTTMKRLTVIMTFLTIVSIVVSVPGTVGAIFGIPALSDMYFKSHTNILLMTLISTTLLSVILGYVYWRSLKLKSG